MRGYVCVCVCAFAHLTMKIHFMFWIGLLRFFFLCRVEFNLNPIQIIMRLRFDGLLLGGCWLKTIPSSCRWTLLNLIEGHDIWVRHSVCECVCGPRTCQNSMAFMSTAGFYFSFFGFSSSELELSKSSVWEERKRFFVDDLCMSTSVRNHTITSPTHMAATIRFHLA